MTYTKPSNVTYTDMAIWIDANCYLDTCDDIKLYEYLYHLLYMIAHEHKYFNKTEYYDDYALQGASKLFMRLKDPKQHGDNPKLAKIKSILNYIKTVSYPYKVDYEKTNYLENPIEYSTIHSSTSILSNYISEETDIFDRIEFEASICDIPSIIKNYIRKTVFGKNLTTYKNICISCMLTIINNISLTAKELQSRNSEDILKYIDKLYVKNRDASCILYHLPSSMNNYIKVMSKEIQHVIAKELSESTYSKISNEISIKNLIAANLEDQSWD